MNRASVYTVLALVLFAITSCSSPGVAPNTSELAFEVEGFVQAEGIT